VACVIGAVVLAAGCALPASPGVAEMRGVLTGTIIGGLDRPLAGALVTTAPPTRSAVTDSAGDFVIAAIPVGDYVVTVARDGASVSFPGRARSQPRHVTARLPIWRRVWSDEFDGDTVDETLWKVAEGSSGVPDHMQRFRRRAVSVADGRLRITTVPDTTEPGFYEGALLQSHRMFTYGRFEVRAKLPTGQGMWPAHWLWSHHTAPEIDIMEMLGDNPRKIYMTYHYGNARGTRRSTSSSLYGPDRSKGYHRYALEWYPGECRWFVDDVEVYRTPMIQPAEPLALVIDTFVGGNWPGAPDETTTFPQYHDVDYARVWQATE
jgi:beta-glucanase (GH16 family)